MAFKEDEKGIDDLEFEYDFKQAVIKLSKLMPDLIRTVESLRSAISYNSSLLE